MPLTKAEAILSHQTLKHQPDCPLLSHLREPGEERQLVWAATSLLEELVDGVEGAFTITALVIRYI